MALGNPTAELPVRLCWKGRGRLGREEMLFVHGHVTAVSLRTRVLRLILGHHGNNSFNVTSASSTLARTSNNRSQPGWPFFEGPYDRSEKYAGLKVNDKHAKNGLPTFSKQSPG